jgi:hypothetical protein
MPDNQPSPSHADKIKFERNLMQITGMTRTQLRRELKRFNVEQQALRQREDAIAIAAGAAQRAVEVRETKLAPSVQKLETGTPSVPAPPVFQDETVPTNSGASGASVLKTSTNVIARKLIGTGALTVTENTDDITLDVPESTYTTEITAVFLVSDGTDITCQQGDLAVKNLVAFEP